jgi:hypothetical protein
MPTFCPIGSRIYLHIPANDATLILTLSGKLKTNGFETLAEPLYKPLMTTIQTDTIHGQLS